MKIAISIFAIIISLQCGIAQQFEYKLPREPNKYSKDVIKVDVYKQRILEFDTARISGDYEMTGNPKYRHEFDKGLLINHFTYELNRTVTYDYNKVNNLASRLIETENHRERVEYQYDFDKMKLEAIKNDTQTYLVKYFDDRNRVIREIDPDEYTGKNTMSSRRYFYDQDRLKLKEYYENGILKVITHYSFDRETEVETILTFNESGKFYSKRIEEYDGEDLAVKTEFGKTGEQKYKYLYFTFRDENGNITKKYKLNTKTKVADIYEYRIEYKK